MKIKGIIRGKTIELAEQLPIPERLEIFIEIPDNLTTDPEGKWEKLQAIIGVWKDNQEIAEIFTDIDRERHADLGQPINFDDLN